MSRDQASRAARATGGGTGRGGFALLALWTALGGLPAPVRAAEPLVIRVADAVGAPGEQTAIILRTYASRPVRRGRTTVTAASGLAAPLAPAGSSPFSSVDSALIFSAADDAIVGTLTFDDQTGVFVAEFESTSATINAEDGVLAVIYATIGAGSQPGHCWPVVLSPAVDATFLTDPDDDSTPLEFRNGEVCVRAATDPRGFEVDGGKVHPGSGAILELGTAEPYALESGRIVLDYDETLFSGLPTVSTDPRHGQVDVVVSHPQAGRLQIDFTSDDASFNTVPGDIVRVHLPTRPDVAVGTISPLTFQTGPGQSALAGSGGSPLAILWASDQIEFVDDPNIYADNFETGDYWIWSAVATP
jgi:hypothetical protein